MFRFAQVMFRFAQVSPHLTSADCVQAPHGLATAQIASHVKQFNKQDVWSGQNYFLVRF